MKNHHHRNPSIGQVLFQEFDPLINDIISKKISPEGIQDEVLRRINTVRNHPSFQREQHESKLQQFLQNLVSHDVATRTVGGETVENPEFVKDKINAAIKESNLFVEAGKVDLNPGSVDHSEETIQNRDDSKLLGPDQLLESKIDHTSKSNPTSDSTKDLNARAENNSEFQETKKNLELLNETELEKNSAALQKPNPKLKHDLDLSKPLVKELYDLVKCENHVQTSEESVQEEPVQDNSKSIAVLERLQLLVDIIKGIYHGKKKHPVETLVQNVIPDRHNKEIATYAESLAGFSPVDVCKVIKDVLDDIKEEEKNKKPFLFNVSHKILKLAQIKNTLAEVVMHYLQSQHDKNLLLCGTAKENLLVARTILNILKPYIKHPKQFALLGPQRHLLETGIGKILLARVNPTPNSSSSEYDSSKIRWNTTSLFVLDNKDLSAKLKETLVNLDRIDYQSTITVRHK